MIQQDGFFPFNLYLERSKRARQVSLPCQEQPPTYAGYDLVPSNDQTISFVRHVYIGNFNHQLGLLL